MIDNRLSVYDGVGVEKKPNKPVQTTQTTQQTSQDSNLEIVALRKEILMLQNKIKQYEDAIEKIKKIIENLINAKNCISDAELELYDSYSEKMKINVCDNLLYESNKIDIKLRKPKMILTQMEKQVEEMKQVLKTKQVRLNYLTSDFSCL